MATQFVLVLCVYALFALWEALTPTESEQGIAGRARNLLYTSILIIVGGALVRILYRYAPLRVASPAPHRIATSLLFLISFVFVTDLLFYWYHRAQHHFAWLWPIHELHHSDAELNATSSLRTYWLDKPVQALAISLPAGHLVGLDRTAEILLPIVAATWLVFTHANVKLRLGWLSPVICGPQVHRIHHSIEPRHRNRNFAQFFPVIDVMFGTYYGPAPDEFPRTGTSDLASDASLAAVLMRPLRLWTPRRVDRVRPSPAAESVPPDPAGVV